MVYQVIFSGHVSSDIPKFVETESVERIYSYCRQKGLTGLKLYTDGGFFFISEGSRSAIENLKDAYEKDPRLSDLVILLENDLEHPEFKDFKIGFCKSDTRSNIKGCFTITSDNFETILPHNISNDTKILTKTFARVNNLLAS